ncbi:MAG: hypothetical protein ABI862_17700, partial [Ilumatobacteraceae bacterium]
MNPSDTIDAARPDRPSRPLLERPDSVYDMTADSIPEPTPCALAHRSTPPRPPPERIVAVNEFPTGNRAVFPICAR